MGAKRFIIGIPILAVIILLVACGYKNDVEEGATINPAGDDGDQDDTVDDSAADDTESDGITESDDLGAEWKCGWPSVCIWDYLDFLPRAQNYANPISEGDLQQQIADVENGLVEAYTDPICAPELRDVVLDILGIRFLVDGIGRRQLDVVTTDKSEHLSYREHRLLFVDPYVGTFEGILLEPKGRGPFPAVVAIHGHRDDAGIYMRRRHGHEYPSHGDAILMLTMRGMGIDAFEHRASKDLLLDGFTLIGMRVYETLLGARYLRHLPEIDGEKIGLIGHSGGSSASNLTIRIDDSFAAYVSDMTNDYCEWGTHWEPWHCETVPRLWPYNLLINDFSTSSVPVLQVPYSYTDGMSAIFDFFDEYLNR